MVDHVSSPFLQTLIGAAAAVVGGLAAAIWQTSHADKIARSIRQAERRERGLLELSTKVSDVLVRTEQLFRQGEQGQAAVAYQNAIGILGKLSAHWNSDASGVIPDGEVINAYDELRRAVYDSLPGGSSYAPYLANLQAGDKDATQKFMSDFGRVLMLLGELNKVTRAKVWELQGREPQKRRMLDTTRRGVRNLRKSLGRIISG
jgi:hypothetical protein